MLIGAGGQTKAELEHALGVHRSRSLATKYSQIHGNLSFLRIANILALSRGFSPKDIFLDFIQRGFGTKTKEFDFINKKIESVDEVTFCQAQTQLQPNSTPVGAEFSLIYPTIQPST